MKREHASILRRRAGLHRRPRLYRRVRAFRIGRDQTRPSRSLRMRPADRVMVRLLKTSCACSPSRGDRGRLPTPSARLDRQRTRSTTPSIRLNRCSAHNGRKRRPLHRRRDIRASGQLSTVTCRTRRTRRPHLHRAVRHYDANFWRWWRWRLAAAARAEGARVFDVGDILTASSSAAPPHLARRRWSRRWRRDDCTGCTRVSPSARPYLGDIALSPARAATAPLVARSQRRVLSAPTICPSVHLSTPSRTAHAGERAAYAFASAPHSACRPRQKSLRPAYPTHTPRRRTDLATAVSRAISARPSALPLAKGRRVK